MYSILFLLYVVGVFICWCLIKDWDNNKLERAAFSAIWPLTLALYGIYLLHKKF